jgi:hypothetical protein
MQSYLIMQKVCQIKNPSNSKGYNFPHPRKYVKIQHGHPDILIFTTSAPEKQLSGS